MIILRFMFHKKMEKIKCIVVGAGIVGASISRKLSNRFETILLESSPNAGMHITSRNSEVLHRGIYYPKNSLKAKLCVDGVKKTYEYLRKRNLPFNQCGKLIVATCENDVNELHKLHQQAIANGVDDLKYLSKLESRYLEPNIECFSAIFSPLTGVFDSHAYLMSVINDAESNGCQVIYNCEVSSVKSLSSHNARYQVNTSQGVIHCDILINSAGFHANKVVSNLKHILKTTIPEIYGMKGNYFKLTGKIPYYTQNKYLFASHRVYKYSFFTNNSLTGYDRKQPPPFRHLVYPIPMSAGLGIHVTLDMQGNIRFGPDTQWTRRNDSKRKDGSSSCMLPISEGDGFHVEDYEVDTSRIPYFVQQIQRYYKDIDESKLIPDYVGIRPKLYGPQWNKPNKIDDCGRNLTDFLIEGPATHGVPGLVNLFGIESPGLTSSISIADYVNELLVDE